MFEQINYQPQNIQKIFNQLNIIGSAEEFFENFYDFLNK